MTELDAVMATLEAYADAYCAKDIDRLMAVFDDGDDISLIGTGADELRAGRADVEAVFLRNFADATATRFQWHWRHVTLVDGFAVVAITLTIRLETRDGPLEVPVRWTVAMARKSGRWRWLHRHASSAAASQATGAAYPAAGGDQAAADG